MVQHRALCVPRRANLVRSHVVRAPANRHGIEPDSAPSWCKVVLLALAQFCLVLYHARGDLGAVLGPLPLWHSTLVQHHGTILGAVPCRAQQRLHGQTHTSADLCGDANDDDDDDADDNDDDPCAWALCPSRAHGNYLAWAPPRRMFMGLVARAIRYLLVLACCCMQDEVTHCFQE